MKKWKVMLCLALCLILMSTLIACGASEQDEPSGHNNADVPSSNSDVPVSDSLDQEEISEISWYIFDVRGIEEEPRTRIEAAVNAITEQQIGVHVNMHYWSVGDYAQQLNLAVTGGEVVDLCVLNIIPASSFTSMYASGQLMDVSPYLAKDGVAATLGEQLADYLDAYTIDGGVYGFPVNRLMASNEWVLMRKDILDELELTDFAQNMTTWSEYEQILEQVATNYDTVYGVSGQNRVMFNDCVLWPSDSFAEADTFDTLGDPLMIVYTDQEGKVMLLYDQPAYVEQCKTVARWREKGLIYPDVAIQEGTPDDLMKQGVLFSNIVPSELGVEAAKQSATGYEVLAVDCAANMMTTSYLYKLGCAVPVTSEEPEAAMKFANLLYTNKELMNLIVWGEEGEDYVVTDGEAGYPEGKSAEDASVYHFADFVVGNQFLVTPWQGSGADLREVAQRVQNSAPISHYLGFAINSAGMDNMISSVSYVKTEYATSLECGAYTQDLFDEFMGKLDSAGVDEYLRQIQTQLDAWLAGK